MLASILIIGFSLILLMYWFRYSCLLLLREQTSREQSPQAMSLRTADSRFSFGNVQALLKTSQSLDPLHQSLQRDYVVLKYLLDHATSLGLGSLEDRLLVMDYKVMNCWYRLTKGTAPQQAREALSEMASILAVLVQKMGNPAGIQSEA
jgi:hypothetical protein